MCLETFVDVDVAWDSFFLTASHLFVCPKGWRCQLKLLRIWLMRPAQWLATTDDGISGVRLCWVLLACRHRHWSSKMM